MNTFEMNNERKTVNPNAELRAKSPVVEVFAAMVKGESLEKFGAKADPAVAHIKSIGERAANGDFAAISELNEIRRFVIEPLLMEEIRLLSIFGSYQALAWDDSIEREVYQHVGERSRVQAPNSDVVFPAIEAERYSVPSFTISGGFQVDYRRVALGDMSKENEGLAQVRVDIMNRAKRAVIAKVYAAIKNATGVKYHVEAAGLTKAAVDGVIANVRRIGRPTVIGDYALLSQFSPWAGYVGSISSNTITGISDDIMNELMQNGLLGMYNGAVLAEIDNPYDFSNLNAAGTNFQTMLPQGLGFVLPSGGRSPIATWTRGGLTSFSGNDVKTGRQLTRFDLEVAVDVAKGHEFEIGVMLDTNLTPLAELNNF